MSQRQFRIGINGFGRTGRQVMRAIQHHHPELLVVAINDLGPVDTSALLLRHDSVYGAYPVTVSHTKDSLVVAGEHVRFFAEESPSLVPWKDANVDFVIEATGHFNSGPAARDHLHSEHVKAIFVCAPAPGSDSTVVFGINHLELARVPRQVISTSSCTTTAAAPILSALDQGFGIVRAFVTSIHSYTNSQRLLDKSKSGPRDSRSAINIVPMTTGAETGLAQVLPGLVGKVVARAIRVPTMTVSLLELTVRLHRPTSADDINGYLSAISSEGYHNTLGFTMEPLVSSDFRQLDKSSVISGFDTSVHEDFARVLGWYDHEYGYACRVADLVAYAAETLSD